MEKDPDQHYQSILRHLRQHRRRLVALELIAGLLLGLSAGLLLGLAWVGLEALLYLGPPGRTALGLAVAGGALGALLAPLRRRLPARLSLKKLGLHLEDCYPRLQQGLISSLELWPDQRAHQLYSEPLLAATVARTAALLPDLDWRLAADLRGLASRARWLGLAFLLTLGSYGLFSTSLEAALHRCAHPLTPFARQPRTRIAVHPGDLEVVKGEDVVLDLRFSGALPRTAHILKREAEIAPWQREEIVVDRAASLTYTFKQVKRSFSYQVRANDGRSQTYRIGVIDPPRVQRLRLEYRYPAYSGLPVRIEEDGGDLSGLAGTTVNFEISASKPLREAALVIDDSLRYPARTEDHRAFAALKINASGHYHLELVDRKGIANRDPIHYAIQVVEDTAPRVSLIDPGRDMDLPESHQVMLKAEATDDFGVTRATLVFRVNDGEEERLGLRFERGRKVDLEQVWDLSARDLLPEDRIYYHLEVLDNDQVSGPKQGTSREYILRFPSLYELFEEVAAEQEAQMDVLEELAEQGEQHREYLEQVRRELLKTSEMSWEQKKELEATLDQEAERARAVEELTQELEETIRQLEENDLGAAEVLDKLEEIRRLMEEVVSPDLREALAAVQQAMDNLDPGELSEALKQFNEEQGAFQEHLDRTLALLRQIQVEQRFEAAVQQAADLERRQTQIDAELDQGAEDARLQAQEGSLKQDTERLQEDLEDLSGAMEPFSQKVAQDLANQAETMKEQALSGRMQEMIKHLQQQQAQPARRLGQALEQDLGALSASLQHLQGEYVAQRKEQLGQHMQQAIRDLLHLSLRQEGLGQQQGSGPAELAQEQFALRQGANQVVERLGQVARKTMSLSPALPVTLGYVLQSMQEAAHHLGQRNTARAAAPQQQAMGHLNESVLLLRESLDNLAKARMPSSFSEAMQQMMGLSEQQADLNKATQRALAQQGRQPGQGRQVPDLRREMVRLAAEQRRIYQALGELERALRGHGGAQKRVRAIEGEMEPVLRDLERRRPDRQTLDTQKRILQRMLDASRSLHTRGFEKKRRGESGRDRAYIGPAWLPRDLGQSYDQWREAMKRALEGPYPDEYRPLIRHYYEMVYQDLTGGEGSTQP